MTTSTLPTYFAPAERASVDQILQDADFYAHASLLAAMLDAVPDIILVLNTERQIVFANQACLRLLNLPARSETLGLRPGELLDCIHAAELEGGCGTTEFCRNCGAVQAILSSNKGIEAIEECRINLRSGDALDLRASAKPIFIENRHFSIFTLHDISGEKRRRALERMFFHDVLNTAGIVSMCAEIMKKYPNETADLIEDLSGSAQQLIEEIQGQRDLAAAETGELQPKLAPFDVSPLLRKLAQQYEHHWVADQRHIHVIGSDKALTVTSDPTLLGRVVGNMIKNALEATAVGGTVTVTSTATDRVVTIAVHNPTAMPRNIQLQIFNRSFSTKGEGRGLGTYSMKLLTERYLGGHVSFESSPEKGTTFYATLPTKPAVS